MIFRYLWLSVALFVFIGGNLNAAPGWEYVHTIDNVRVSKREVANSDLIAVKGRTVLPFSRGEVLSFMIDHKKRYLWVDRLKGIDRIKTYNGKLDAISYYKVDMPWPVTNRDFVVRTKISYNPKTDMISSTTASVKGEHPMQKGFVRAFSHESTVTLKVISSRETEIELVARIDPKGHLPHWLVNYLQTKWAHLTLTRLKEALSSQPIEIDPAFFELMKVNQS